VAKSATLAFPQTAVAGADTSIALRNANVDAKTTQLTLNLPLQAGQHYTLRRGPTGLSSTFTATLVDAAGKQTALNFKDPRATSFTVGMGGAYKLILSDTAPIKGQVDAMSLDASALEKTTNLALARAARLIEVIIEEISARTRAAQAEQRDREGLQAVTFFV
jgi:hypothetical protein